MAHYRAELTGVFGDPVDDNPTMILEEAGYQALGLNYRYLTIKVLPEDLESAMNAVRAMHFRGINLTMPHKIKVIPMLDELSEAAQIIGAVNTVINDDGRLIGENTDGKGFTRSLMREGVDLYGKKILILGAGGAARAIAVECALAGAAEVKIASRKEAPGQELSELIRSRTKAASEYVPWGGTQTAGAQTAGAQTADAQTVRAQTAGAQTANTQAAGAQTAGALTIPSGTDILINATPIGFTPHADTMPEIDYDTITESMIVSDVVFDPVQTRFLQKAAERGARTFTGIGMLVQQGALNFTYWTGEEAPVDVMYEALERELSKD